MTLYYIVILGGFSVIFFTLGLMQLMFNRNKRLEKRMKHFLQHEEKSKVDPKKLKEMVDFRLARKTIAEKVLTRKKTNQLGDMIKKSGIPIKVEEYLFFQWISIAFCGLLIYLITEQTLLVAPGGMIGFILPKWFLKRKQKKRMKEFNEGLPDMLSTMIGSLRAGFSLPQSLQTVVAEGEEPIKSEIEQVVREMQYGSTLEDALHGLYERMPSQDLELMIQAIIIQRQVGGNLATVLDKIVDTIRDRTKIQRQVVTLTAQGRLSGLVIGLLPVVLAFILYLIEPEYIGSLFTHPIGQILIGASVFSATIGFILIQKITTIEV
ncbi:type II secretion system F family protein [Bacillaceae bacterium S4-13-58]